jgi:hypothetical protein
VQSLKLTLDIWMTQWRVLNSAIFCVEFSEEIYHPFYHQVLKLGNHGNECLQNRVQEDVFGYLINKLYTLTKSVVQIWIIGKTGMQCHDFFDEMFCKGGGWDIKKSGLFSFFL